MATERLIWEVSSGVTDVPGIEESVTEDIFINVSEPSPYWQERAEDIWIGFLRDPRLRIREPIYTMLDIYPDNKAVATADVLGVSGSGDNQSEAIADLQRKIADLYFSLEKSSGDLEGGNQEVWEMLQTKIRRL